MRKTVFNLFLIVIICFLASFIPLNTSYMDFSQSFFDNLSLSKPSKEIEAISSSYETNLNDTQLYNPTNIEFTMIGNFDKGTFSLSNSHDMVLEVFSDGELIKKYVNTEFVTGVIDTDGVDFKQKYSFDISQENLKLYGGPYKLVIYSTADIFKETNPYEVTVSYLSNSKYISSKDTVDDGSLYLTLYFPDENYEYLVPVSRKIDSADYSIRFVLDNLELGPKSSMALSNGSPVPNAPRIWVSQGVATLHLPTDIGIYDQGSAVSGFALHSFVNTLTSLDGIDKVKFLSGGKEVDTLFHGLYVKEPFEKNTLPKVYLGLETKAERFLLTPIDVSDDSKDMERLIPMLFKALKTTAINGNVHSSLTSTIPERVTLLNYEYDNGILNLNLSSDFLKVYSQRIDMQDMMLESILYTFTSIPDVTMVSIKVEGNTVDQFNGLNLSVPMATPRFINIEDN